MTKTIGRYILLVFWCSCTTYSVSREAVFHHYLLFFLLDYTCFFSTDVTVRGAVYKDRQYFHLSVIEERL